uniref:Ribokinase n=1 Tax=Schistocephalus solidus TaxID=70667 RepID=A0A0X3PFG6_SCHSO
MMFCIINCKANADATLHAMEWAKAHDVLTILDPAPAPSSHSAFAPLLPRFLAASSIVCPNETEAAVLTGIPRWEVQPDQIPEASIPWLLDLWKRGVKYPLVTLGMSGVIALLPRSESTLITAVDVRVLHCDQLPDDKAIFHLRAPVHAKAMDTTVGRR